MPSQGAVARVVLFGATGYTGRLTAEAMTATGARPVLAGRDRARLEALATRLGGLPVAEADTDRPDSVRDLVGPGDVLVSTVGPFLARGEPAVRAAVDAGATYLDATGEPPFLRRVFEEHGPRAAGRSALIPAFGYDFVPGNLAGALALAEAGEPLALPQAGPPPDPAQASPPPDPAPRSHPDPAHVGAAGDLGDPGTGRVARVAVGYFVTGGGGFSSGTMASGAGLLLEPGFAWRGGELRRERTARRVRAFPIGGREWLGVTYGGSEHLALPRIAPGLREVEVYLGWFGRRSRAVQVFSAVGAPLAWAPGARPLARAATGKLAGRTGQGPDAATRRGGGSLIVAVASDAGGRELAQVRLRGPDPYTLTARLLAWGAQRAAGPGVASTGALGPVDAFGLEALQQGAATAGLERADS